MSASISRRLYCHFLALYPEPFRREFGDEMRSMFEECRSIQGALRLLTDLLLSVAKQRIHNFAKPLPKNALFSPSIGPSSNLARVLAAAILSVELTAGVLAGRPATPYIPAVVRHEVLVWSLTTGWGRYCSATPNLTSTADSANLAAVLVAIKLESRRSWRIVRIACGHDRFVEPPLFQN